jgi:hypothetical protein
MKLREPIFEAHINRLAGALETLQIVRSSRGYDGYVQLSGENAN